MQDFLPEIVAAFLTLICGLIAWVVYGVHTLQVEFRGMKDSLKARIAEADKDHARYDGYEEDIRDITNRLSRLEGSRVRP